MTFESFAAKQLTERAVELTERWAAQLIAEGERVALAPLHLAGSMPSVLRSISRFIESDDYPLLDDPDLTEPLATVALLKWQAGRTPAEILLEFDELGRLLQGACLEWLASYDGQATHRSVVAVSGRLNRAPLIAATALINAYWREEQAEQTGAGLRLQEFADLLSRELNTPLNAASISAQLLEYTRGGMHSDEAHRLAVLIRRNLDRADAVLRNIRHVALSRQERHEAGGLPFGQVLASVLAELNEELETAGGRIDVEEPIPAQPVPAAPIRVVLTHLIRNAIRFRSPDRPLEVRLCFRYDVRHGVWWVEIVDNGLGIPAAHQPRVFREAFRAHDPTSVGIGLMVVEHEVRQLGGSVAFASVEGSGSTFRFALPAPDA